MKSIDLLSQPPANVFSIFSERRNRTNLGGCIFIIELIAIIAIIFIFLFDHYNTALYKIEYSKKYITQAFGIDKADMDERLDEEKKFNFKLTTDYYGNELSENFVIADFSNMDLNINGDYRKNGVTKKPSKLYIAIYYKCHNETVCKYFERGNQDKDYTRTYYNLEIYYPGFEIRHQDIHQPIIYTSAQNPLKFKCPFIFDTITYTRIHWTNVKYEEKTGMWSRLFSKYILKQDPVSYVAGYIDSSSTFPIEVPDQWKEDKLLYARYKLLAIMKIDNNEYEYEHYVRTKNSVFVTIANIAALISTTNFALITFLNYYSRNYDNYKIIRHLTSKKNLLKNEKLKNFENKDDLVLNKELKYFNNNIENKKEPNEDLINKEDNNELLIREVDPELENAIDKGSNKINFIYFFLNGLYCDGCKRNRIEDMINVCNEILDKYLSIDNLLYNQIMMENLLKDYKWNDNSLNSIKNNALIIKYTNLR